MPRRLIVSARAIIDLSDIHVWLTQVGAGASARRRFAALHKGFGSLMAYPSLHPVGRHPGTRERQCEGGYRIIYEVLPDTGANDTAGDVHILRIFGPGQSRDVL